MKVAVIGSRGFNDYELVKKTLSNMKITLLVSGGAKGADTLGEQYAKEKGIETKIFLPDWDTHGKAAGMLRNTDIINESEVVVAFWDGTSKGTLDSINKAKKLNKKLIIIDYELTQKPS
jgi:predicted Rossmann fold nucleotide-binding protein DprA/Smf involved in DNA uptake